MKGGGYVFGLSMEIIWVIILILSIIIEAITCCSLVTLWFIPGSIAGLICNALGVSILWQWIIFLTVSILSLVFTRPIFKKLLSTKKNVDTTDVGKIGLVIETIDNLKSTGRIHVAGLDWTARSLNNEIIDKGASVKIEKQEANTCYVSKIKEMEK